MKLYLIETLDYDLDEYDSAVIAAEDEENAISIWNGIGNKHDEIFLLAKEAEEKRGVILASFNAG